MPVPTYNSLSGSPRSTRSGGSNSVNDVISSLNALLEPSPLPQIHTIQDVTPSLLLNLYEVLFRIKLPYATPNDASPDSQLRNIRVLIGHIAHDVLKMDLSFLEPRKICEGDEWPIKEFLRIYLGVCGLRRKTPSATPRKKMGTRVAVLARTFIGDEEIEAQVEEERGRDRRARRSSLRDRQATVNSPGVSRNEAAPGRSGPSANLHNEPLRPPIPQLIKPSSLQAFTPTGSPINRSLRSRYSVGTPPAPTSAFKNGNGNAYHEETHKTTIFEDSPPVDTLSQVTQETAQSLTPQTRRRSFVYDHSPTPQKRRPSVLTHSGHTMTSINTAATTMTMMAAKYDETCDSDTDDNGEQEGKVVNETLLPILTDEVPDILDDPEPTTTSMASSIPPDFLEQANARVAAISRRIGTVDNADGTPTPSPKAIRVTVPAPHRSLLHFFAGVTPRKQKLSAAQDGDGQLAAHSSPLDTNISAVDPSLEPCPPEVHTASILDMESIYESPEKQVVEKENMIPSSPRKGFNVPKSNSLKEFVSKRRSTLEGYSDRSVHSSPQSAQVSVRAASLKSSSIVYEKGSPKANSIHSPPPLPSINSGFIPDTYSNSLPRSRPTSSYSNSSIATSEITVSSVHWVDSAFTASLRLQRERLLKDIELGEDAGGIDIPLSGSTVGVGAEEHSSSDVEDTRFEEDENEDEEEMTDDVGALAALEEELRMLDEIREGEERRQKELFRRLRGF